MATKPVAVEGDVSATPGTTPYSGADSGTWTAGAVSYKRYDKLTVGGQKAVYEASCDFSFSGTNSGGSTVKGNETVTLTASSTTLQGGTSNVIRDGDRASGSYGNELRTSASGDLKSA